MRFKLNEVKNINLNYQIDIIPNNFFVFFNCFMSEYLITNNFIDYNDDLYMAIRDYFVDGNTSTMSLYKKLLKVDYLHDITRDLPITNFDKEKYLKLLDYEIETDDDKNVFYFNKSFTSKKMFLSFSNSDKKIYFLKSIYITNLDCKFIYKNEEVNLCLVNKNAYTFYSNELDNDMNDEKFFKSCKEIIELDESQKEVVRFNASKNLVVLAGAGSGKTRTLCARYLYYYFVRKIPTEKMLMVTFTKRAADGMKEKCVKLFNEIKGINVMPCDINARTIDSFIRDILFKFYDEIGFNNKPQYKIGTKFKNEYLSIINSLILENGINFNVVVNDFFVNNLNDKLRNTNTIDNNYSVLIKLLKNYQIRNNVIYDFAFANLILLDALKKSETLKNLLIDSFDAVLIDEFQDINDYQNELFEFFYDSKKIECTFVGDDDQSIYFWRGSNNEIIKNIKNRSDTTQKFLNINYRNNPYIVRAGNEVLSKISDRSKLDIPIIPAKKNGEKIRIVRDDQYYNGVINEVERLVISGVKPGQIAILSRFGISFIKEEFKSLNFIIQGLELKNIKYQIKNIEVDMLIYYQIIKFVVYGIYSINGVLEQAKIVIENFSRNYFPNDANSLNETVLIDLVFNESMIDLPNDVQIFVKKLKNIVDSLKSVNYSSLYEILKFLVYKISDEFLFNGGILESNSYFRNLLKVSNDISIDLPIKVNKISKFFSSFESFSNDNNKDDIDINDMDTIKVSTIHGFKGLEFDYVFIIDLNDKNPSFPNFWRLKKEREEKEIELKQIITESKNIIVNNAGELSKLYFELVSKNSFNGESKVVKIYTKFVDTLKENIELDLKNEFMLNVDNVNMYLLCYRHYIEDTIVNPLSNKISTIKKELDKLLSEFNIKISNLYQNLVKEDFLKIKKKEEELYEKQRETLNNHLNQYIMINNVISQDIMQYSIFYNKMLLCESAFNNLAMKNSLQRIINKLDIELSKKEDEEKKLFYVAITRSSKILYLVYNNDKSQFIDLISKDLVTEYHIKNNGFESQMELFYKKYNELFSNDEIDDSKQINLIEEIHNSDFFEIEFKREINLFLTKYYDYISFNKIEKTYLKCFLTYYYLSKKDANDFWKGYVYNLYNFCFYYCFNRFKNYIELKLENKDVDTLVKALEDVKTIKPIKKQIIDEISSKDLSLKKIGYELFLINNDESKAFVFKEIAKCCYDINNCFIDTNNYKNDIYKDDIFEFLLNCSENLLSAINKIIEKRETNFTVGEKVYSKKYGIGVIENVYSYYYDVSFNDKIIKLSFFDIDNLQEKNNTVMSPSEIFKNSIDKIVEIESYYDEGVITGTGFYIDSTHILTNAHVVIKDNYSLNYYSKKYKANSSEKLMLEYYDIDNDLAILKTKKSNSYLNFTYSDVDNGEVIYSIGNSLGEGLNILNGIVSDFKRIIDNKEFIMCNLGTTHGNSGGPVLNNKGDVVGVLTLGSTISQSMNYAIPWYTVRQILKKWGFNI